LVEKGVYINYSDKEPVKIISKEQDSVDTENRIVKISPDSRNSELYLDNFSFKKLFVIMWSIII
jgi:hypothetical protein